MKYSRYLKLSIAGAYLISAAPLLFADGENNFFPYLPRLSTLVLTGSHTTVRPDLLLPAFGNEEEVLFLNAQGKSNLDTAWVGSLGAGYRQVYHEKRVLGVYVFGDRNVSPQNNTFWFVSPGLESLGQVWDFRANGYIPVSSQKEFVSTNYASDLGDYTYVVNTGHEQYDTLVNTFEEVGWGADAEIGRTIPVITGLRLYVGGYHFNLENTDDINGVAGRIEYPITSHMVLDFRDSYDNQQHNSAVVGVRFSLGGIKKSPYNPYQPAGERLLDPVERNMSTLTQGTAEPVVSVQEYQGYDQLQRANIWYFDDNAMSTFVDETSCTAEHPCSNTSFNQSTIDQINTIAPHPSFYFRPGQYSSLTNGTPDVFGDDALFGRTEDYKAPQQSSTFVGGMVLNGSNMLDSIILVNDSTQTQTAALNLNPNSTTLLNNVRIGVDTDTQGQAYVTGISMNNSTLNIMGDSEVHAYSTQGDVNGIAATGQNTINLNNSHIEANSVDPSSLVVHGISVSGSGNNAINLTDSSIHATAQGATGTVEADGIYMSSDVSTITLQNSAVDVQSSNTSGFGLAYGINTNATHGNTISVSQGEMHVNSTGSTSSQVFGISAASSSGDNVFNLSNTSVTANASSSGNSAGAQAIATSANNNTINVSNSFITANATGNYLSSVFGITANAIYQNTFSVTNSSITAQAISTSPTGMANAIGINSIATTTTNLQPESDTFAISAQAASYSAQKICVNNVCY